MQSADKKKRGKKMRERVVIPLLLQLDCASVSMRRNLMRKKRRGCRLHHFRPLFRSLFFHFSIFGPSSIFFLSPIGSLKSLKRKAAATQTRRHLPAGQSPRRVDNPREKKKRSGVLMRIVAGQRSHRRDTGYGSALCHRFTHNKKCKEERSEFYSIFLSL